MKQRGRISKAKAMIPARMGERFPPPDDMPGDQSVVWLEIINRMPSDYFAVQNLPLLAQYCRHTVNAARIDKMVEEHVANGFKLATYDKLLTMQGRESKSLCALSAKMRLAQNSLDETKHGKTKNQSSSTPIWEA